MAVSINGWAANNRALVASQQIPGSQVKVTVRKDAPGLLLLEVASAFDRLVEDIDNARGALDDWGYAERPIRGGAATSNHASGTAIDLNATKHPFKKKGTFTAAQVAKIRQILKAALDVVDFGGDWTSPVDEMHFEIAPGKTMADCQRALESMRKFNGSTTTPTPQEDSLATVPQAQWDKVYRQESAALDYRKHHGAPQDDQLGHTLSIRKELGELRAVVAELAKKVDALTASKKP